MAEICTRTPSAPVEGCLSPESEFQRRLQVESAPPLMPLLHTHDHPRLGDDHEHDRFPDREQSREEGEHDLDEGDPRHS